MAAHLLFVAAAECTARGVDGGHVVPTCTKRFGDTQAGRE
jgi:hypothetical protein